MTNEEILERSIEKARANGYTADLSAGFGIETIFSHDFAKAFWEDEAYLPSGAFDDTESYDEYLHNPASMRFYGLPEVWQYHLQQMVLEEDPIKYLEQFLGDMSQEGVVK